MDDEIKKTSEDNYADIDFDDEEKEELGKSEFIPVKSAKIKIKEEEDKKFSQFFNKNNKLLAEKIIEKKSGKIIEIKYDLIGNKERVIERGKNKKIKRAIDYHANGTRKLVTDYGPNGSYKSMMYNIDGSRQSYVDKHEDGTSDAIYFNADGKGSKLLVKLDANKEVIEKKLEK